MLQMRLYENLPQDAMCIREKVFMEEQVFCQEFDEIDEIALHGVLYEDETAVATARLYFDEKEHKCFVIGRLAVVREYRGKHYGEKMLAFLEEEVCRRGGTSIGLSAQKQAMNFYKKQGFIAKGDFYMDEECPHIWMQKEEKMLNKMFQSIIDQDRAAVVICDLTHKIVYMNPAAIRDYEKWGGEALVGKSLMKCHNQDSCEKIGKIVEWFSQSEKNNMIYIDRNEKENKDVYMVALRDSDKRLIGYYEKHEYRNDESAERYDFTKSLV